ncbi:E3 ubiquitin-protein ligase [Striga asiatica]|uniref:E3 ubiquitin-protein ligase n=1 Tax=Striga asiatica TaxID=4170 RepID=A0A5A7Q9K9_STRAF|nr:E3 ubiquitin-protein ligase [Striga asiatica]
MVGTDIGILVMRDSSLQEIKLPSRQVSEPELYRPTHGDSMVNYEHHGEPYVAEEIMNEANDTEVETVSGGATFELNNDESGDESDSDYSDNDEEQQAYDKLKSRTCPQVLVSSCKKMNAAQKRAINEIGFGSIFHLSVYKLPRKLGYWLLDNFQPKTCEIKLQNGHSVHIESKDVALVLGFPNGERAIQKKRKHEQCSLLEEWGGKFVKDKKKILPTDVSAQMLSNQDGGLWFIRHFLILLTSCLIETSGTGYILPQIMSHFSNTSAARHLNWCDYVLECLVNHHLTWAKNKKKSFNGPIFFLMMFYVDRVVIYKRIVPRGLPLVRGWTNKLLRDRQKTEIRSGGFGGGYPSGQHKSNEGSVYENVEFAQNSSFAMVEEAPNTQLDGNANSYAAETFMSEFLRKSKMVAVAIVDMLRLVEQAPHKLSEHSDYKRVVDTTESLLVISTSMQSTEKKTPKGTIADQKNMETDKSDSPIVVFSEEVFLPNGQSLNQRNKRKKEQLEHEKWKLICSPPFGTSEPATGSGKQKKKVTFLKESYQQTSKGNEQQDVRENDNSDSSPPFGTSEHAKDNGKQKKKVTFLGTPSQQTSKGKEQQISMIVHPEHENHSLMRGCHNSKGEWKLICSPPTSTSEPDNVKEMKGLTFHDTAEQQKLKGKETQEMLPPTSHCMERRNKKDVRKSEKLLSPYHTRVLAATSKFNKKERDLCFWILDDVDKMDEAVFSSGHVECLRRELLSIRPSLFVSTTVVDVWATVLNNLELLRSHGSPLRFFFTVDTCAFTIVNPAKDWSIGVRRIMFYDSMTEQLQRADQQLENIDILFFPIHQEEHCYIMCLNVKKLNIVLIDNSTSTTNGAIEVKYSDIPSTLVMMVCEYLDLKGLMSKSVALKKAKIERLQLPWALDNNEIDCGVYVMRHMETYMGDSVKNWKVGLRKNSANQLKYLRAKYCATILSADINIHKEHNLYAADLHYRISKSRGSINVEKLWIGQAHNEQ